jgi:hypothetical protein
VFALTADNTRNAVHGSDAPSSAIRELTFFFSPASKLRTTALLNNTTLGVIKVGNLAVACVNLLMKLFVLLLFQKQHDFN